MFEIIIILICFVGIIIWRIISSTPENIGKTGEKRIARKLDWLPKEYIVLNDIMLPTQYGTTQIDHIVISPYGIFVIETKNFKGWIFGHENSEEWTQSLLGKKHFWGWSSEQHKFRNPIRQNQTHTRAIKRTISNIGDFKIIPIVVFLDKASLSITAPNYHVINWRELRSTIKRFRVQCIETRDVKAISNKLLSTNIVDKEARKSHTGHVQNIQINKQKKIDNRICPQCHSPLVERKGKYGRFLGCSNYPKCKFTAKLES